MKTNMDKLRGKIVENRMTLEDVATKLGVDYSTFYRKMKADGLAFTVGQMHQMVDILSLTPEEATQIFLQ